MSHSHAKATPVARTGPVELPPPAWGSPAHLAQRKAEKEWKSHLRAHASADAEKKVAGKHTKYVDAVDIIVRYELPPHWDLLDGLVVREGDSIWELPEDDEQLVKVLKASQAPFFQRTGEFAQTSPAFKPPPTTKSPTGKTSPLPASTHIPVKVDASTPIFVVEPALEVTTAPTNTIQPIPAVSKPTNASQPSLPAVSAPNAHVSSSKSAATEADSSAIQPRKTYLPVFISNMLYRIGHLFLWFIPGPLRVRLHAWWSPVLGRPATGANRV